MTRKVHSEGLRERKNMKNSTHKNGEWCIVGFCTEWENGFGLQGWNIESKSAAKQKSDELDDEEEFFHVSEHKVMKHKDFEELCEEKEIMDKEYPWN